MTEFINLQVYGVPIATFGLVGITTAILAYTTATSGVQNTIESITDVAENPVSSLSNLNPIASLVPSPSPSSNEESQNPLESLFNEEKPTTQDEVRGGKRVHRKTPRHKKSKNNSRTKKHKK